MDFLSSIIHNSQKIETPQMPINWWIDKYKVVYPYSGILFCNKKKWSTNTRYKIDKPENKVSESSQSTKHPMLSESICIHLSRIGKLITDRKYICGFLGLRTGEGGLNNKYGIPSGADKIL